MISFYNDYNEISHPLIMEEFNKYMSKKFVGYSEDEICKEAIDTIKKSLKYENVDIHFIQTGTMANVLSLMFCLDRFESVITPDTGHIVNTENGSVEAVGHQLVYVENEVGKVTSSEILKALKKHSHEYNSKPRVVYISNATELGTIYKKSELEQLSKVCKENGLYLFMDGARLAASLMSEKSDLKFEDLPKYLDIFTIGGNKNGFMFGEAIVIVNDEIKTGYERLVIKQRGSLLAKGFLYGIQFKKMFEDGLYFELGKHSSKMASKLQDIFKKHGIDTVYETEANLVFVELPVDLHNKLKDRFMYSFDEIDETKGLCRFVCTWDTKDEYIEELDKLLG